MRDLELQLQAAYPQFRRIWVRYSNHRGYRMCITLFPQGHGRYQMLFGEANQITFEIVDSLIREYLERPN
jgi:hypothetical protein